MSAPQPSALVAVVGPCQDRQRLLSATLYALGCRIHPLAWTSHDTDALRQALAVSAPDVLVWQVGSAHPGQCGPLLQLLHSGVLERTGLVLTTPAPAVATVELGTSLARVHVLGARCGLIDLMRAVVAASRWPGTEAARDALTAGGRAGAQRPEPTAQGTRPDPAAA